MRRGYALGIPRLRDCFRVADNSGVSGIKSWPGGIASIHFDVTVYPFDIHRCTIRRMHRMDHWRPFLMLAVALIVAGAFRSAWATRLDGFTVDEPWHVTAGVAYLRTGEYYLNPEHPQ